MSNRFNGSRQLANMPTCRRDNSHTQMMDADFRGFPHCVHQTRAVDIVGKQSSADLMTSVWLDSSARWLHFGWANHLASWHVRKL